VGVLLSDITYVKLHREFVYLAVVMDLFIRCIRGWNLCRSLGQQLTLVALEQALANQVSEIHHSDQGVQDAATAYVHHLEQARARISAAEMGQAWQNRNAGRVMRSIKQEEIDLSEN